MLKKAAQHGIIAIKRIPELVQVSRTRTKLGLDLEKSELVRRGHLRGKIPSRLRAQNQQAGISKPVAKQQH